MKPVLWDALGNITGSEVLDLECGYGWLSGELLGAGAHVTGIDGSAALLAEAKDAHPEISFLQHDSSLGLPHTNTSFDRIVAHMVLMDIFVLDELVSSVRRAIKPGGKFIFTRPHPCFFNQNLRHVETTGQPFRAVTGYHQEEAWHIEGFGGHNHYHRSLTTYFELLRAHGFAVSRLFEPEHIPEATERESFWRSVPAFILLGTVRQADKE